MWMSAQFAAGILLLAACSVSAQSQVSLGKDEKQAILDTHNAFRVRTARGETARQPSATDMTLLEWDDRLMNKAAEWAMQCIAGHDPSEKRLIPGYSWVGQNYAGGDTQNMSYFVQLWYDEYKDFTYSSTSIGTCVPEKPCGHYTQVVWSKSLLVGCASFKCPYQSRNLVCNYAEGGNLGTFPPYAMGAPASQCHGEHVFTEGSVCLRRDQCLGPQCRCAIQCLNGGTLDPVNCKCSCSPNFYGVRCELACADNAEWSHSCQGDPGACTSFADNCPKTCRLCVTRISRDKNVVNPDGVEARVPGSKSSR